MFRLSLRLFGQNMKMQESADHWTNRLDSLKDIGNYTPKRVTFVIKTLFHIYLGAKTENNLDILNTNPVIFNTLNDLIPIIRDLSKEQTILLIRNLSMFNLKTHEIWNDLENHLFNCFLPSLDLKDAMAIIQSYSKGKRKSDRVWQTIETELMTRILNREPEDMDRYCGLYGEYLRNRCGSPEFLEDLARRICKRPHEINTRNVLRMYESADYSSAFNQSLHRICLGKIIESRRELENHRLKDVIIAALKYGCEEEQLKLLENELTLKINTFKIQSIHSIINAYLHYRPQEKERVNNVLEQFETLMHLTPALRDHPLYIKIMILLLTENVINHAELWTHFLEVLSKNPELFPLAYVEKNRKIIKNKIRSL